MTYDYTLFFTLLKKSFFNSVNTVARLKPKRIFFLFLFILVWIPYQIITWFFLGLDELFFPDYHQVEIKRPLFILGNYRSGSTFLHRLFSKDRTLFTSMRTVDIFFMPSITQKVILKSLSKIDIKLGGAFAKTIKKADDGSFGKVQIHKVSLFQPEEDENVLFHIWSTFFIVFLFPFLEEFDTFIAFDEKMPQEKQEKIMAFYKAAIQRHLYLDREADLAFISKSPANSPKIKAINATFPDARILYLARNPLDMLPSTISWLSYAWRQFNDPPQKYIFQNQTLKLAKYWYMYPLSVIDSSENELMAIMNYDKLIHDPEEQITQVFSQFGYDKSPGFKKILKKAAKETREYTSVHKYSYEEMGFTEDQIVNEFFGIFERFGFNRRGSASSEKLEEVSFTFEN
ncbi:MAG TPA: sulfotransferase [Anaerolineales bacterium]|nr:sulfotransferase [Anaerolineales bacterium]